MKLLVAARYHYYGDPNGIEPQFYYLAKVPEAMGKSGSGDQSCALDSASHEV